MNWHHHGPQHSGDTYTSETYSYVDVMQKPVEIYVFIDLLCPECWSLEPYLRKLSVEYGRYFTLRPILSGHLNTLNKDKFDRPLKLKAIWEKTAQRTGMSCDGDLWIENPVSTPWFAALAIKAAELQGKKAGRIFLRKVQESLFLKEQDISDKAVLINCAYEAKLDVDEFQNDLYSTSAKKALHCDFKLTNEMEVDYIPAIVFFNQFVEQHGIKISGLYPYDIYVRILKQMLQKDTIIPSTKPPLEDFLAFYEFVGSKEISVVYDWSLAKTEREMKKLQLKRIVKKVPVKHGTFWQYSAE